MGGGERSGERWTLIGRGERVGGRERGRRRIGKAAMLSICVSASVTAMAEPDFRY